MVTVPMMRTVNKECLTALNRQIRKSLPGSLFVSKVFAIPANVKFGIEIYHAKVLFFT